MTNAHQPPRSLTPPTRLRVRELLLPEVDVRIDYFHGSSDEHLLMLGVDRTLLPSRRAWREIYEVDYARPIDERQHYTLAWEFDERIIGFSSLDQITYGEQAFMHLHILATADRRTGMGTNLIRLSAAAYFRTFELKRLYCQPNAFNVAPNRTLQRAGFRYEFTRDLQPSPINFLQPVTRWVLEQPPV
jgi:RimJ/RimL family protein N-acetyltransferase